MPLALFCNPCEALVCKVCCNEAKHKGHQILQGSQVATRLTRLLEDSVQNAVKRTLDRDAVFDHLDRVLAYEQECLDNARKSSSVKYARVFVRWRTSNLT